MRAWGWVAVLSILGSLAYAQSLGDVAKRERERREKKKQQGTETAKVIHEEDLVAAPSKDSKGNFNPGSGFTSEPGSGGSSSRETSPSPAPPNSSASSQRNGVDLIRVEARQRLESSYASISQTARSFFQAAQAYGTQCVGAVTSRCRSLLVSLTSMAVSIGAGMADAEEAARQAWLNPGDVSAMRRRYGMDAEFWDKLVDYVRQYRR